VTNELPTAAALLASEHQPSSFEGLVSIDTVVIGPSVIRQFACECGSQFGKITAGGGFDLNLWWDPLIFACNKCKKEHHFFDSRKHGYEGQLGLGERSASSDVSVTVMCPECASSSLKFSGSFFYNIEIDDLEQLVAEENIENASDLYDALSIKCTCELSGHVFETGEWELG
jgi:Zn finger protein HypA/HybF involved in hydrogenase expression